MDNSYDFRAQRLFVAADLATGVSVPLDRNQTNYLLTVLRLGAGAFVNVFNGRDGEWRATVAPSGKREATLLIGDRLRAQTMPQDIHYLFAPLKRSRLDYLVQKATELGVSELHPVMTQHTSVERVNIERLSANVIEAAEQCGVLSIPTVVEPRRLAKVLSDWPAERHLVLCDEAAPIGNPIAALRQVPRGPLAVLIGPEGGFSKSERVDLLALPNVTAVRLGPRIMRADTAAVAVLALVNAMLGDWA